uniref:Polyketide cyclase/dehydrase n=1 Tax=Coccolithus braarudii TaxID=221442 RepID=A0A7S0PXA3_9EUKA|mmetsp:Transcript_18674/g.40261  ORF Transcript_18674/g.40261 Transcript_18674/m.40261 type:complete len:142 (+) Transcript_18674:203-628(+)
MGVHVRTDDVRATPARIWSACFTDMKWETWDPDVVELANVQGGLVDGGSFDFIMKEGPVKRVPCKLSNVNEAESLTFSGRAMGGLLTFKGTVELKPKEGTSTTITYTFELGGCVGGLAGNSKAVVGGVEQGLANMKSLSEA